MKSVLFLVIMLAISGGCSQITAHRCVETQTKEYLYFAEAAYQVLISEYYRMLDAQEEITEESLKEVLSKAYPPVRQHFQGGARVIFAVRDSAVSERDIMLIFQNDPPSLHGYYPDSCLQYAPTQRNDINFILPDVVSGGNSEHVSTYLRLYESRESDVCGLGQLGRFLIDGFDHIVRYPSTHEQVFFIKLDLAIVCDEA